MADLDITLVGSSDWASGATTAGTPAALAYPAGIVENDAVYLVIHNKLHTNEPPDLADWTKVATVTGGGGTAGTGDQGQSRITLYKRIAPSGGLSGAVSFTFAGNTGTGAVLSATVRAYRAVSPGAGLTWAEDFGSYSRATSNTTMGGTIAPALDLAAKDRVAIILGSANDAQTVSSGPTIAASGATFGTVTKSPNANAATATGADLGTAAWDVPVTAGASTSGPTITATSGTSATGIGFAWRIRASDSSGAPVVDAGPDATVQLGQTFARTAGETGSGITSRAWTILSGPAGVGTTIGTAAALSWLPAGIGSYVLQYAASSPSGTGADTVTVTVTAAPGQVYPLTNWKLTLPTGPAPGDPTEIEQPELASYSGDHFFLNSAGRIVLIAPVQGVSTSEASGATRAELREMQAGTEAAWSPFDPDPRQLTVTMRVDPTSITDRQEVIIGQIHGAADSAIPLILSAEWESGGNPVTPRIRVFQDGPGVGNMLGGAISTTTDFTYRIRYDPHPSNPALGGTVSVFAAVGDHTNLPGTAQFVFAASDFTDQVGWYFKVGAYNKSPISGGGNGQAVVEISYLELIQPGDTPTTETHRFYLTNTAAPWAPGVASGFWDDTTVGLPSPHHLGETPAGSAAPVSRAETSTDSAWFVLLGQWVSHPATSAGSLVADTIALVVGAAQSASDSDLRLTVNVGVLIGSTSARRGTALNLFDLAGPFPTTAAAVLFDDLATEVAFQPGDRIIVELGFRGNTLAASHTGTLHIGGTGTPDLAEGSTTLTRPGWIDIPVTVGVQFLPSVDAPVAAAAGTGSAGALSAATQAAAGVAAGAGAASAVGSHMAAPAGTAAGSGSAGAVVGAPSVASVAGAATGAGAAGTLLASVRGATGSAVGAGTAGAPRAALAAVTAAAAGSGSAGAPAAGVLAPAATATGVGSALEVDGIGASAPPVTVAHGTGSAGPVQARVHPTAGAAVGSGSAGQAAGRVAATAAQAGGTGSAAAAGAVIAGRASTASGVGSAGTASSAGAVFADAGTAGGTGVAAAAAARVSATAGTAAGAGTAGAVTSTSVPTVNAQPATAAGTGAAGGLSAATKAAVGAAVGAGGALSPAARIVVLGQVSSAAGTGTAGAVLADVDAAVSTATGSGTAPRPEAGVPGGALSANGTGTAGQVAPSMSLVRTPNTAGGVGAAGSAAASVTARPATANGTGTASWPSSTSIAVRDALAGMASGVGSAARVGATLQAPTTAAAGVGATGPTAVRVDVRAGAASGVGAAGAARTVVAPAAATAAGAGSAPVPDGEVVVVGAAGAATGAGSAGGLSAELVSKVGASSGVGRVLAAAGSVSARAGTAAGVGSSGGVGVHLAAVLAAAVGEGSASEVRGPDSWVLPWRVTARRLDDRTAAAVVRTP